MAAMSDFLENKLIDWLFRGQSIGITGASAGAGSGPTNLYIALLTSAPSDVGGGTEVSGGSYARVAVASNMTNWAGTQGAGTTVASSGTSGTTSNNASITFPAPTANWGSVTHVGVYDASSTGNLLFWAPLAIPKTINNGDAAPYYAAGAFSVQIDN
jgi:hypothetical protein